MSEATAPARVQPTREQRRKVVATVKQHMAKHWPAHIKQSKKDHEALYIKQGLEELDKQLNPPPPPQKKPKERINGMAAAIAMLAIYEGRFSGEREPFFDFVPVQEIIEKITKLDKKALPMFFMVLHDFLAVIGEGSVPSSRSYLHYCNVSDDDLREVREQLGYDDPEPTKGKVRG